MIRYRIGDIGIPMEPGDCAVPRMEIQAGRETDFVVAPEGRCISGASLTLISAKGISKLQFVQTEQDSVTVRYVKNDSFGSTTLADLREQLRGVLGGKLQLKFMETDEISVLKSGKYQYVHSEVAKRRFCTSG